MSEAPHFSRHDALIPAPPQFMRDWILYLKTLWQYQQYREKVATIVAEKYRHPQKFLLGAFLLIVPAALNSNLKSLSELKNEQLVIAMCELNALADQALSYKTAK